MIQSPPPIKGHISLTPLIDVVFVLLVFFMVTMSLKQISAIEISASQPSNQIITNTIGQGENISKILLVKPDVIRIESRDFASVESLVKYIKNTQSKTPVTWVITPDTMTTSDRFLHLWQEMIQQGIAVQIAHKEGR